MEALTIVIVSYASVRGQALIDRALYLGADWAADEERRMLTHVPDDQEPGPAYLLVRRHRYTGELSFCRCHSTAPVALAALAENAARAGPYGEGVPCWVDAQLPDVEAGTLFHDALFGPDASPDFGRADLMDVFPPEMPPRFLVHFGVEDSEAVLGAIQRLGGRVQVPPFDASYGRVVVVADDQGASFALLQR